MPLTDDPFTVLSDVLVDTVVTSCPRCERVGDFDNGLVTLLDSLDAAERAEPTRLGPIGFARSVRDPEVQAGLGYLLTIARALGQKRSSDA